MAALESYSSHLEPSFIQITLPPTSNNTSIPLTFDLSPSYTAAIDKEFSRVYQEFTRRIAVVKATSEEIVNLWAELGTPQAQTDSLIIRHYRESPEQLGIHESDISRLQAKRDRLLDEKRNRERKLKELRLIVEGLWDRLDVEELDRKRFFARNRGCGLRAINEFEAELDRLNELKRQNLHLFVEDARCKLQELWDELYFSEEEMLEFTPAFSDVYSDALLSAHEGEIDRLKALKEQRAPILEIIDKHRSLIKDRDDLTASSQDASRLMGKGNKGEKRDPTRLLREEKMRKRISKDLPKIEVELKKTLERWEDEYGRPFLVHGQRYLDELAAAAAKSLPPRSKTPSGPAPVIKSAKAAPVLAPISAPASRAGSVMRAPPPRSGAKSPIGTLKRNPLASSVSSTTGNSPSKIPSRVPLGTMRHGNNSPERRTAMTESTYDSSTLSKMGPPLKAPPPKMRDIFVPHPSATPTNDTYDPEYSRCASVASSSTSGENVRQIPPEDVYDDRRENISYMNSSVMMHHSQLQHHDIPQNYRDRQFPRPSAPSSYEPPRYRQQPPPQQQSQQQDRYPPVHHLPESRQISSTSTASNAVSGSENWETYDDASEPEQDATEAYYAKLKAGRERGKRFTPEGGYSPPRSGIGKKMKGGVGAEAVVEGNTARVISDAWTDEEVF